MHALCGNIGDNDILCRGQAQATVAIAIGQARHLSQLIGRYSADRETESHGRPLALLLVRQPQVIAVAILAHVGASELKISSQPGHEFRTQARQAPFFHQKRKAALGPGLARSVVTIEPDKFQHDFSGFFRAYKNIQRRSHGKSAGAHLAPYQQVEPKAAIGLGQGGNQSNILRLTVRAILQAPRHYNVHLPRKVGEFRIAVRTYDFAVQLKDDRRSIQQFKRRQPRQGTTVDVAHVVHAGLQGMQIDATKLFPYFRHAAQGKSTEFNLLPRGYVYYTVPQPLREVCDRAQLFTGAKPIRHADPHHELAGRRLAKENTTPLQQVFLRRGQRLMAALDDGGQVLTYTQAVAVFAGLTSFNRVDPWTHCSFSFCRIWHSEQGRDAAIYFRRVGCAAKESQFKILMPRNAISYPPSVGLVALNSSASSSNQHPAMDLASAC